MIVDFSSWEGKGCVGKDSMCVSESTWADLDKGQEERDGDLAEVSRISEPSYLAWIFKAHTRTHPFLPFTL